MLKTIYQREEGEKKRGTGRGRERERKGRKQKQAPASVCNGDKTRLMKTVCICAEQWVLGQMSSVGSDHEEPGRPG